MKEENKNIEDVIWKGKPKWLHTYLGIFHKRYCNPSSEGIKLYAREIILNILYSILLYYLLDMSAIFLCLYLAVVTIPDICNYFLAVNTTYQVTNKAIYQYDKKGNIKKTVKMDSIINIYSHDLLEGLVNIHISYKNPINGAIEDYKIRQVLTTDQISQLIKRNSMVNPILTEAQHA